MMNETEEQRNARLQELWDYIKTREAVLPTRVYSALRVAIRGKRWWNNHFQDWTLDRFIHEVHQPGCGELAGVRDLGTKGIIALQAAFQSEEIVIEDGMVVG